MIRVKNENPFIEALIGGILGNFQEIEQIKEEPDFDTFVNGVSDDNDFNFGIKDLYPGQRKMDEAYINAMTDKFREMITLSVQHQHEIAIGHAVMMAHLVDESRKKR